MKNNVGNYKELFKTKEKAIDTICRMVTFMGGVWIVWYLLGKILGVL